MSISARVCFEDQFAHGREGEKMEGREEKETEVWGVVAEVREGEVEGAEGEVVEVWEGIFLIFFFWNLIIKKGRKAFLFIWYVKIFKLLLCKKIY